MKRLSKILAIFLCLVTICSAFASCNKKKQDEMPKETTANTNTETESSVRTDENGYVMDDLPETYDWADADFNVYAWSEMKGWEWCQELTETSTSVDSALYNRMRTVEDRFQINFNMTYELGNWDHRVAFVQKLEETKNAGEPFDLVSQYSHAAGEAAVKQLYVDLNSTEYVDLNKPWWPEKISETATIGDKLYFATGDITPTLVRNIHCMYVNLAIYDAYSTSDLFEGRSIFQIVKDGDWTIAAMEEMALDMVDPVNGMYGISFNNGVALDAFYFGAGFRMVNNDNGVLELSDDLVDGTMIDYYDRLTDLYHNPNTKDEETDKIGLFHNNKSFVHAASIADAQRYTEKGVEFALVPMPKLNSEQAEYYTVGSYWVSMFGIPVNATNRAMSGMVLEGLASAGHRSVRDKVYFDLFQARFMGDADKAEMLDIVTASVIFDAGRTFSTTIGSVWADVRDGIKGGEAWTTIYASKSEGWAQKIAELFALLG